MFFCYYYFSLTRHIVCVIRYKSKSSHTSLSNCNKYIIINIRKTLKTSFQYFNGRYKDKTTVVQAFCRKKIKNMFLLPTYIKNSNLLPLLSVRPSDSKKVNIDINHRFCSVNNGFRYLLMYVNYNLFSRT